MADSQRPFWERKSLQAMTTEEWESLCDGCGRCCLHKLEDEDSGEVWETRVACKLLDTHSCRCSAYAERKRFVPDCLILTPDRAREFKWLPETCAYRRLAEGKPLPQWHPLISGDPEAVHRAGVSVRDQVISEEEINLEDLEDYVVDDQQ